MFRRLVRLSENHSFFLFGPRGSGKSTLIRDKYLTQNSFYIDLLQDSFESRYARNPDLLMSDVRSKSKVDWVIIDEVQKVPRLLDLVHKLISEKKIKFILTGSSARKLRRSGANLLAGRAFLYYLYPLTSAELGSKFDLKQVLSWGSLPQIYSYTDANDKAQFLKSYTNTYLKEEIMSEQLVRNVDGFRNFLEVAAQMNAKAINYSKIGREAGVEDKTVQTYYEILQDTLVGFLLPSFHRSVRKAQTMRSKFYFFDLGVVRALENSLDSPPVVGTSGYGVYFESFLINEIYRCNAYSQKDYKLSHYQTSTGQEIDLVLSKGKKTILIEIKSTSRIDPKEVQHFEMISEGFKGAEKFYLSLDPVASKIQGVNCLHWQDFLDSFF